MIRKQTKVSITSAQRDLSISPLRRMIALITQDVLDFEGVGPTVVQISFLTDEETKALHKEHFNDPSSTDCMTFPVDSPEEAVLPDGCLGEIVICPRTAILESHRQKTSVVYELTLYLVHGLLHLIGFRDDTPARRKTMKAREKMHMLRIEKHFESLPTRN